MRGVEPTSAGWTRSAILAAAVSACVFLALPGAQLVASAGGAAFWMLALAGIALWVARAAGTLDSSCWRSLWFAALAPLALLLVHAAVLRLPMRDVSWTPLLGLPLIALAVARARVPLKALQAGAMVSCAIALGVVLVSRYVYGQPRVELAINRQLYGLFTVLSVVVAAWSASEPSSRAWRACAALATGVGLAALMMMGYRAGLLALPLVIAAFLRMGDAAAVRRQVPRKAAAVALAVAVGGLLVAQPRIEMVERAMDIPDELIAFEKGDGGRTAVGSRLALWHASWRMVVAHPWVGVGAHRFSAELADQQRAGLYPAGANRYAHPHNSYLRIAAEFGVVGLAVMGLALAAVVRLLGIAQGPAAVLGRYLLGSCLLLALTNDLLSHQSAIRVPVVLLASCIGIGLASRSAARDPDGRSLPATPGESITTAG
jgi:O-antigen ligase